MNRKGTFEKSVQGFFKTFAFIIAAGVLSLSFCLPANAAGEADSGNWQFSVAPYLWLPAVNGTLKFDVPPGAGGSPEVEAGPDDLLAAFNFAMMVKAEARKGDFAVFTDIIYLDLEADKGSVKSVSGPNGVVQVPVNVDTSVGFRGLLWQLAGSYTVARGEAGSLDVLGGFRYLRAKASFDWNFAGPLGLFPQSGSFSETKDLWDAIVGIRGKVDLGKSWFIPYYGDIGTGSSSLTWQAFGGVGYAFKWGDLVLAYRHLSYDQSDDKLLQNFRISGPLLGANFRF